MLKKIFNHVYKQSLMSLQSVCLTLISFNVVLPKNGLSCVPQKIVVGSKLIIVYCHFDLYLVGTAVYFSECGGCGEALRNSNNPCLR